MGSSGTKISCHAKISLGSFQYWPKWWRYIKFVNLRWWASQFHGFFILILIPLNQYIFSVFLIKLTNFGGLLCLNGGSNGPEINFSGHVIDGLRADGLWPNKDNLMSQETSTKTREHTHTHLANLIEITLLA